MQQPLDFMVPRVDWRPTPVSELPSWRGAGRVSVDLETCDPHLKELGPGVRRGAYIVGASFAIEDGPAHYLPIRHEGGGNLPEEQVLAYLRDQADTFEGDLCGANMQYDLDFLEEARIHFRKVRFFRDCQIAEPLLDELQDSYSLEAICERRGLPGKDERGLREAAEAWGVHPKKELWKLQARYAARYAIQDAVQPLQLLRRQERLIDEQDLWDVYDLESRLLPVLVKLRRRGVLIDQGKLAKVEAWSEQQERECLERVRAETGVRIKVGDVWKAEAIARALERAGIEVGRTPKTNKPSVTQDALEKLDNPVAREIIQARKVNKLRTTFAESIRRHMTNGRIHCTFNQLRMNEDDTDPRGARYGRLSSSDPNMQQQPSRDEFADFWRSIYVPEDGCLWASCDYSQQEPRMAVHYAVRSRCKGAERMAERYRRDPLTDSHTAMARIIYGYPDDQEPTKPERTNAKIIFLGLCYGMGGAKLAHDLGLPTQWVRHRKSGRMFEAAGAEAQSILDQFDRQAPFVRQLRESCEKWARRRGYVKTLSGRRCRFPVDENGRYDWTHKALNRVIQGSSADQMKMAMLALDAAGHYLQLQIHDEADGSVQNPAEALAMGETMRHAVPDMEVPFRVDVEVGPSWGEVKAVAA